MANELSFKITDSVGVVGLGLMGSSIIVALLISGHKVKAIAPIPLEAESGILRIKEQLNQCLSAGIIKDANPYLDKLTVSESYQELADCKLVLECVIEQLEIKSIVYQKIAEQISVNAIIASNTSAIPISVLQAYVPNPERFMGIHWAEPAHSTRFLEIICGDKTNLPYAEMVYQMAENWGKEPTLLRKDISGFVTNRLMYAVYREAFAQVESGKATMTAADKAFKYDVGSWITFMGIFRRLEMEGLIDKLNIAKSILPTLSNSSDVPQVMQEIVAKRGRGIYNQIGLFEYTEDECEHWEKQFANFIKDISALASKYPSTRKNG